MIGYKLLNKDMKAIHGNGNGMQYELGKKYFMNKKDVKVCSSGYHFYKSLEDCINSDIYNISNSRFFKVETGEYIEDDEVYNTKSVSNEITLLEEISKKDIIEYCKINRTKIDNISLAKLGLFLDELVNDEDWLVKREVARQGKYLDILVNDEDWFVRLIIAGQGKCLDILVNDESSFVRKEVARQGKYLDILVNDESSFVREEVARQGKYLDILVNDEDWTVRSEAVSNYRTLNK